jgi:cytochrome c oxidase subunit 4
MAALNALYKKIYIRLIKDKGNAKRQQIKFVKEKFIMGMAWFNVGSLVLGLVAWILPIINLAKYNKAKHKNWIVLLFSSMSACTISVLFQIVYQNHLVQIEDWSAVMDTIGGVLFVSTVLFVVAITLNLITLIKYRRIMEQ